MTGSSPPGGGSADVVLRPEAATAHDPDAPRGPTHHVYRRAVRGRRAGGADDGPVTGTRGRRGRSGRAGRGFSHRRWLSGTTGRRCGEGGGDQKTVRLRQAGERAPRPD